MCNIAWNQKRNLPFNWSIINTVTIKQGLDVCFESDHLESIIFRGSTSKTSPVLSMRSSPIFLNFKSGKAAHGGDKKSVNQGYRKIQL